MLFLMFTAFELQFEDDVDEEERSYYVKTYPNVNMVADKKVHCTVSSR